MKEENTDDSDYSRRRVLQVGAAGIIGLTAGCINGGGNGNETGNQSGGNQSMSNESMGNESMGNESMGNESMGNESSSGQQPVMTVTGGNDGGCIDVDRGSRVAIELRSQPGSTGYQWHFTQMSGLKKVSDNFEAPSGSMVGGMGKRKVVVEVRGKGNLKAKYARTKQGSSGTTFSLSFSGGKSCPKPDWSADHEVGKDKNGGCISVSQGDTVTVTLPNQSGSTGYSWMVDLMETSGVEVMENRYMSPSEGSMPGASGEHKVKFKANKNGVFRMKNVPPSGNWQNADGYSLGIAVSDRCENLDLPVNESSGEGMMSNGTDANASGEGMMSNGTDSNGQ